MIKVLVRVQAELTTSDQADANARVVDVKLSGGSAQTSGGTGTFGSGFFLEYLKGGRQTIGGLISTGEGPDDAWEDTTLVTVDGVKIKAWHASVTGITIIVLSSLIGLICCIVSYRKRKAIAAGARRASEVIVRTSVKVRRSISRKFTKAPDIYPAEIPDEPINVKRLTRNRRQQNFLHDLFSSHEDHLKPDKALPSDRSTNHNNGIGLANTSKIAPVNYDDHEENPYGNPLTVKTPINIGSKENIGIGHGENNFAYQDTNLQ